MSSRAHPVANLFPLVLAGLLVAMSFWLEQASRPRSGSDSGLMRHDPDYTIDKFHLRRFDETGVLQHTLLGDRLLHYPDDDSTTVMAPRLTYHRDPPTFVTAREGRLNSGATHVELIDDVRVIRGGKGGKPDSVLTTQRLNAYPDDEIARTDIPVNITQGQSNVRGLTLNANNKTATYVIDGEVRGVFYRNQNAAAATTRAAEPPPAPLAVKPPVVIKPVKPKLAAKPSPKPKSKSKPKKAAR
jgi:lipopolysaccharide export system protein LptC